MRRLIALLMLSAAWPLACAHREKTPPPRQLIPYHDGIDDQAPMQRVVLVPLVAEDADHASAELFGASLRNALVKRNLFEVVQVSESDLAAIELGRTRSEGVFRTADLITVSKRFGADGVICGAVSRFRSYPAVQLGARLSLIDCRVGHVRWASEFFLDAADGAVDQDVHNYHDINLGDGHVAGHRTVLISPRLFSEYAATRTVETLEQSFRRIPVPESRPAVAR